MYSRAFIESHTVYVVGGSIMCADCGEEKLRELEERRESFRARVMKFIDSGSVTAAKESAEAAARAEADRAELADAATLDDGEADSPRSCDECHAHIDGALTPDGARYVAETIHDYLTDCGGDRATLLEWSETYFSDSLPWPILPSARRAILKRFGAVDRERRALERDRSAVLGRRYRMVSDAAARLRDAWVRFAYGSDDVRKTLRPSLRARR